MIGIGKTFNSGVIKCSLDDFYLPYKELGSLKENYINKMKKLKILN